MPHNIVHATLSLIFLASSTLSATELRVVCSVPDLADLVRQVGGDAVEVEAIARPGDNPHFISARPSYVRSLADADAFVVVGMDLEVGWAPALVRSARNNRVRPGRPGYIECSAAIEALEVPDGTIDRSQGDVHPHGNPHYLLSPRNGIQVLGLLGDRLAALDPERADDYRTHAASAAERLAIALYGPDLVAAHAVADLVRWQGEGVLREHVDPTAIGGWLARMAPLAGSAWIDDHAQWPYLADCYDLRIVAHLEPKAGVPPSSTHLQGLVALAGERSIAGILTAPWFDPRHARSVAEATGLPVVPVAHQVGARADTDTYHHLCEQHVTALTAVLLRDEQGP